jgi:NADPH:quinone reductase-like Zn-dependent oxidoreductase
MRAIAISEFGGADKLQLMDLPIPAPGPGEIQIHVQAAGVNPVDWKIREGLLQQRLPHEFPLILGWDAAGVVTKTGPGANHFFVGNEVYAYCRKPVIQGGTYAEVVVVPQTCAALKPRNLSFSEAAAVPLAGLTAYQALFDAVHLEAGETALIHAAAGGVGTFAVQLAKDRGAYVLGTASRRNHDYLRELGVDEPIDYASRDFRAAVKAGHGDGVDVVFDCVGGDTLTRSVDVLKRGGRLVSILEPDKIRVLAASGVTARYLFVEPRQEELRRLAELIEAERLRPAISTTLPLESAAQAHALSESRHVRGKIVLTL